MTPINLEMIKQLLQEFVDKEAVTAAEINVVQQQVEELETQVVRFKEKLGVINNDKEKILAMTQRYAPTLAKPPQPKATAPWPPERPTKSALEIGNNGSEQESQAQTRKDPLAPQVQSSEFAQRATGNHPALTTSDAVTALNFQASQDDLIEEPSTSHSEAVEAVHEEVMHEEVMHEEPVLSEPVSEPDVINATNELTEEANDDKKSDSLKESVDDTVKSINDALRGLFR